MNRLYHLDPLLILLGRVLYLARVYKHKAGPPRLVPQRKDH